MQKTWCFMAWKQRRLINGLPLALAAAFVFAGPPASAGTPEWMKQVARVPLPSYPADTDAIILLDESTTTVSSSGEVRVTYRKVYKILRPQGRTLGRSEEHTSELQSLTNL